MEGKILNFRRGRHHTYSNHMIVRVDSVNTRAKAEKLVGKKVVWESPAKKKVNGEIKSAHGNKGAIRVLFENGMPGQSIGDKVSVK